MLTNKSKSLLNSAFISNYKINFNNYTKFFFLTNTNLNFTNSFRNILSGKSFNQNSNYKLDISRTNFLHSLAQKHFTTIDITSNAASFSNLNQQSLLAVKKFVCLDVTNVNDNLGARKLKRRLGRGPGSSKGKTSARGHKIRGEPYRHFEGGQTNVFRRLPKHGFRNKKFKDEYSCINIQKILYLIHKGRLDPTKPIGVKEIFYAGGVSKVVDGIKLLSRGAENLKMFPKLDFIVQSATEKTIKAINDNGGSVTIAHGTRLYNRYLVKPAKFTKELVEPYPSFKRVRRMLTLKDKGAL